MSDDTKDYTPSDDPKKPDGGPTDSTPTTGQEPPNGGPTDSTPTNGRETPVGPDDQAAVATPDDVDRAWLADYDRGGKALTPTDDPGEQEQAHEARFTRALQADAEAYDRKEREKARAEKSTRPAGGNRWNEVEIVNIDPDLTIEQIMSGELDSWPEPQPLVTSADIEPYPLDALPGVIQDAVQEVQAFILAPIELVASCALTAVSLAIQAHFDAKRTQSLVGPCGLFFLTIAESGERKSSGEKYLMKAIREHESRQQEIARPLVREFKADLAAWESRCKGIQSKIQSLAREGKPTDIHEAELRELQHNQPAPPRAQRLLYDDVTPEALKKTIATEWPSAGIVSSEGGTVFGSHGMGKDSIVRNLSIMNKLWDGDELKTDRITREADYVRSARLTIGLQIQRDTFQDLLARSGSLLRGSGFLARLLISWPRTTQGTRLFVPEPEEWPSLDRFNGRISDILNSPPPMSDDGALEPPPMSMTPDAKKAWIEFYNMVELGQAVSGELHEISDFASKAADNAARLATLFHVFQHGGVGAIDHQTFEGASRVIAWHLHEAKRFCGEIALTQSEQDVKALEKWILGRCRRKNVNRIEHREVIRNVTPHCLRKRERFEPAMAELLDAGRARVERPGGAKEVAINPALLKGGAS